MKQKSRFLKIFKVLVLIFVFVCLSGFYDTLKNYQQKELLEGSIILKNVSTDDNNTKGTFEAVGIFYGTVEQVVGVLTDYEKYNEFMTNVSKTVILNKDSNDNVKHVEYELKLPLGKIKRYRLELKLEQNTQDYAKISWRKLDWPELKRSETIDDTVGFWELKNHPIEKNHVIALYHVYTAPGPIPFGLKWIVDILTRKSLPNILKNTRKRIIDVYYNSDPNLLKKFKKK